MCKRKLGLIGKAEVLRSDEKASKGHGKSIGPEVERVVGVEDDGS